VLRTVGIGLVEAAIGAASLLGEIAPRAVLFLGTCGAYPAGGAPRIGDVVVARAVKLVDPAIVEGYAALPDVVPTRLEVDASLHAGLVRGDARSADVATTLAITTDDGLAAVIGRASGCEVEHLEAFAVAAACARAGVAFGAVLGVANVVGGNARQEWLRHHREATRAAAAHVLGWVGAGAAGVRSADP